MENKERVSEQFTRKKAAYKRYKELRASGITAGFRLNTGTQKWQVNWTKTEEKNAD